MLTPADVERLDRAGGRLLVSPNVDAGVLARAGTFGMVTMPGVFTATEAFLALSAGASALKFFPASVLGATGIAAIRAVLPADTVVAPSAASRRRTLPIMARRASAPSASAPACIFPAWTPRPCGSGRRRPSLRGMPLLRQMADEAGRFATFPGVGRGGLRERGRVRTVWGPPRLERRAGAGE